ncbi:MAG: PRTRC system protein E [Gallionella sp.]|nr:PRTRC system protein E [Gallionella sp.]
MFTELQILLATLASLTVSLAANTDGTITVTVIPKGGKEGNTLDTPLTLTGTAAELDEGFAGILTSYANKRQNLFEQLAATEAILEAAQKEAADKAKKSIAKPANKTAAPVADEAVGSDDEDDDEGDASSTAPSSPVSTEACTPAAAPDAKALWD